MVMGVACGSRGSNTYLGASAVLVRLCRYMVLLRHGGAYADIDVECRRPLDSIIQPADTLLVGWDTEVSNATTAAATGLARQRLVANWFFVAAAGHPVLRELCDHIARNAMSVFSSNSVRDTAERTGAGVWTDLVLRHALEHQAAKVCWGLGTWRVWCCTRICCCCQWCRLSYTGMLAPHRGRQCTYS
jgi:mannosyltransferase OCH1-like enzyme